MPVAPPTPRVPNSRQLQTPAAPPMNPTRRFSVDNVKTELTRRLPNFYVIHAVEGWGKTSFATMFPNALFFMSRQELGLLKLMENYLIQPTQYFSPSAEIPDFQTWQDGLDALDFLIDEHGMGRKTLVVDTMNGFERLAQEHVCEKLYRSDWSDSGFEGYKRGYAAVVPEWIQFMNRLSRLRNEHNMTIVLLSHTMLKTFKNPEGPDFDRQIPAMHEAIWSITHRAATAVFFGRYERVDPIGGSFGNADPRKDRKGKIIGDAAGGQKRILCTVRHPSYDAKNQMGLPPEIDMGESYTDGWENFVYFLQEARKNAKAQITSEPVQSEQQNEPPTTNNNPENNGGGQ